MESIGDNAFDEGVAHTSDGLPLEKKSALIEDIDEYFLNSLEEFGTVPD